MEYCKHCQAELAEDSAVCPSCGKDNALEEVQPVEETAAPAQEKKTAAKKNAAKKTAEKKTAAKKPAAKKTTAKKTTKKTGEEA